MESSEEIKVNEFMSVSITLAEQCGKIIRQVHSSGDLKMQQKGQEGPVTIADLKVQKSIEENLKHYFPGLLVMGEEEKASYDKYESAVKPGDLSKDTISEEFLQKKFEERKEFLKTLREGAYKDESDFNIEGFKTFKKGDAIVWVDPLDGTTDFVNDNLTAVTVLIGLSVNNTSRLGVVHNPFSDED